MTTNETTTPLCCWCDDAATRNLDSYHDVCCDRHYAHWYTGTAATRRCDCVTCQRSALRFKVSGEPS